MSHHQYIVLFGISLRIDLLALLGLVVQTTAAVTLTRYSKLPKDSSGVAQKQYNNASLVVTTEAMKLMASMLLIFIFDTVDSISRRAKIEEEEKYVEKDKIVIDIDDGKITKNKNELQDNILSDMNVVFPFFSHKGIVQRYNEFQNIIHEENFSDILGTLKLIVPALLYTIQNNVIYIALDNLEATTFQVGYQSKVITTAVLSMLMLNRKLSFTKWIALLFLATGIVMTQINVEGSSRVKQPPGSVVTEVPSTPPRSNTDITHKVLDSNDGHISSHITGLVAVFVASFCSALAGVYFEKILKGTAPSLWVRNSQLAFFSMWIAIIGYMGAIGSEYNERDTILLSKLRMAISEYFAGYSLLVWGIILIQSLGGLIIACVIKYADNILKGFATAISILCCGALSAAFMGFVPSVIFLVGGATVIGATMLYSFSN